MLLLHRQLQLSSNQANLGFLLVLLAVFNVDIIRVADSCGPTSADRVRRKRSYRLRPLSLRVSSPLKEHLRKGFIIQKNVCRRRSCVYKQTMDLEIRHEESWEKEHVLIVLWRTYDFFLRKVHEDKCQFLCTWINEVSCCRIFKVWRCAHHMSGCFNRFEHCRHFCALRSLIIECLQPVLFWEHLDT